MQARDRGHRRGISASHPAIETAITDRTRAIVTVSPNNPTGAVYPAEILAAINGLCKSRNIYHIADEAYEYFTYDPARHFSPASLPGSASHTISLYSLSKAYGMAGWRIGYMVFPSHLEESMKKIQDTNLICPPLLNQLAATAALGAGRAWCQTQIAPFGAVRNLVLGELSSLGDRVRSPLARRSVLRTNASPLSPLGYGIGGRI